MPRLTNITVVNAESIKTGTGKYGPWELLHVKIDDKDWAEEKFSYFKKQNGPEVKAGMKLDFLEYKEDEKDGYVNYTVTKIGTEEEKPKPNKARGKSASGGTRDNNPKSMYYAYGKDITLKLLELAIIEGYTQHIAAHVVFFGELLYKASTGDKDTLEKMNAILKAIKHEKEETREMRQGTKGPVPYLPGGDDPEDSDPDETDETPTYTKSEAKKAAAEWVHKCAEVENIPHLENWWTKLCGSQERKALEKANKEAWDGICEAYRARKEQLKEAFRAEKEESDDEVF